MRRGNGNATGIALWRDPLVLWRSNSSLGCRNEYLTVLIYSSIPFCNVIFHERWVTVKMMHPAEGIRSWNSGTIW